MQITIDGQTYDVPDAVGAHLKHWISSGSGSVQVFDCGAAVRFDSSAPDMPTERERRFDSYELAPPETTRRGFFKAEAILTRAGVYPWLRPDGRVQMELRPPEELLSPRAIDSASLVPVTIEHPPALLTPDTARRFSVGSIGNPRVDGSKLKVGVMITAREGLDAIKAGKRWLSYGYDAFVLPRSGVYVDEEGREARFDSVLVGFEGNHAALTDRPNVGEAAMRTDATGQLDPTEKIPDVVPRMAKIKLDNTTEIEVPDAVALQLQARMDASATQLATVTTQLASANAAAAEAKGKADALEAEAKRAKEEAAKQQASDAVGQEAAKRLELATIAAPILDKPIAEVVRMDSKAIMIAVVQKAMPSIDVKSLEDPSYLRGVFETIKSSAVRTDSASAIRAVGLGAIIAGAGGAGGKDPVEEARLKMIAEQSEAWKKDQSSGAQR